MPGSSDGIASAQQRRDRRNRERATHSQAQRDSRSRRGTQRFKRVSWRNALTDKAISLRSVFSM